MPQPALSIMKDSPVASPIRADEEAATGRAVRSGRPTTIEAACLQDHILAVSWDVAVAARSNNFSLDLVARAARVSKRTIYARFPSKDDLVRGMVWTRIGNFIAALRDDGTDAPLADRLAVQAAEGIRYLTSIEGYVLSRLIDGLPDDLEDGGAPARIMIHKSVTEAFAGVLASALGREVPSPEISFAAATWLEGIEGHSRVLLAGLGHGDLEAWSKTYAAFFLRGLG
jgi:TetR/AcrR family transcriptional repressor of mexJK operon